VAKPEEKRPIRKGKLKWGDIVKLDLQQRVE
jgi:hypothetical protein